jgi:hypothetical protein
MIVGVDTTLGEMLSPSQVNTFLSCLAKWYSRYGVGVPEAAPWRPVLRFRTGSRQKIEIKQDLPAQQLEES